MTRPGRHPVNFRSSRRAALIVVVATAAVVVARQAFAAQTLGPVTDEIGVLRVAKGAPIQIGGYWVLTGPDAALGVDERRGAELALRDRKNTVAGHPARLVVEDDGCSAEGGQTAATKLAANPAIVIVLGPGCSGAATAAAPILWKVGIVDIGTASSAPSLTAPDRKPGFDGFVRTIFSDLHQGDADARWLHDTLKASRVVSVHDGNPYSRELATVMGRKFTELGGTIAAEEAIAPTDVDMHPLLTRIATLKPDAVYLPLLVAASAQILRQAKGVPGLEKTVFIGGGGQMAPELIQAAGASVVGYRLAYPDVSAEAMGKAYPRLVAAYKNVYGELPISGFHAHAYDAAEMAMRAIERVAVTTPDGTTYIGRKALRDAVYATEFEGMSGTIKCNVHGQCAAFKPAVYQFTSADPSTFKIGSNPKKIFP
jgi:branched-chain amino acid transport system substrate-binding protein